MLNVQWQSVKDQVLQASAALLTPSFLLLAAPSLAIPLSNGRYAFDRAPRLVDVSISSTQANVSNSRYQLTITVPQDAGAPLQAITITQPQNQNVVKFQPNETRIFAGNPVTEIPLVSLGGEPAENQEFTLKFHQPVQPGQTVTINLSPEHNPANGGVYLLGITAYPTGDNSPGLFLGYSQFTIQSPSGR